MKLEYITSHLQVWICFALTAFVPAEYGWRRVAKRSRVTVVCFLRHRATLVSSILVFFLSSLLHLSVVASRPSYSAPFLSTLISPDSIQAFRQ